MQAFSRSEAWKRPLGARLPFGGVGLEADAGLVQRSRRGCTHSGSREPLHMGAKLRVEGWGCWVGAGGVPAERPRQAVGPAKRRGHAVYCPLAECEGRGGGGGGEGMYGGGCLVGGCLMGAVGWGPIGWALLARGWGMGF